MLIRRLQNMNAAAKIRTQFDVEGLRRNLRSKLAFFQKKMHAEAANVQWL